MSAFDFFRRNNSFTLVWLGQVLSQSGARMYQLAIVWWIVSSKSVGAGKGVGLFMVAVALPSILLARRIGKLVDSRSRQLLLVTADASASVLLGLSNLAIRESGPNFFFLLGLGALGACLQCVIDPTLNKSLNELITQGPNRESDLQRGVALLTTTQSLANFGGAVLGAVAIAALGLANVLLMACIFYFLASRFSKRATFVESSQDTQLAQESGWQFLKQYPLLKKTVLGFGAVNFFGTPTLVVLPLYARQVLGADARELGFLEASLWIGLLSGALGSRWVSNQISQLTITRGCLFGFAGTLFVSSVSANMGVYALMLFGTGAALGINNVKFLSLFQEIVPGQVKGRFFATLQAVVGFTFPIAYFLFGWLSDLISVQKVCLVQSIGILCLTFYFKWLQLQLEKGKLSWESV